MQHEDTVKELCEELILNDCNKKIYNIIFKFIKKTNPINIWILCLAIKSDSLSDFYTNLHRVKSQT